MHNNCIIPLQLNRTRVHESVYPDSNDRKMKKQILGAAAIAALLLAGCNGGQTAHNHSENDGHDHDTQTRFEADGHDHAESGKGHDDEIVFTEKQAAFAGLETDSIQPGPFRNVIRTSGEIRAAQGDEATVVATANGIVSFPGQAMTAGAPIAAGATVVTISAKNLADGDPAAKAKIAYETALKEYERAKGLVADQIISAKEFEQVRMRYENARTTYEAQAGNVTASGVRVASPINGYITGRLVGQGDYVTVGQPIATVSQNRRLQLRADVPPSQFSDLKTITGANFVTPYDKQVYLLSTLSGRLLSVGKSSDKTSFYIPVTFEFDNTGEVVPGSFVEVFLLGKPQQNVISVPVSALTEEQGVYFVYVQTGNEVFLKREVKPGQSDGERVRILSGLTGGERVVSKGAYQVKLAANSSVVPEGHSH